MIRGRDGPPSTPFILFLQSIRRTSLVNEYSFSQLQLLRILKPKHSTAKDAKAAKDNQKLTARARRAQRKAQRRIGLVWADEVFGVQCQSACIRGKLWCFTPGSRIPDESTLFLTSIACAALSSIFFRSQSWA